MAKLIWMTLRSKGIVTALTLVTFFVMSWLKGIKVTIEENE
jgi:hypothetical protein